MPEQSEIRVIPDKPWMRLSIYDESFHVEMRISDSEAQIAAQCAFRDSVVPLWISMGAELFVAFGPGVILIYRKQQKDTHRVVLSKDILRDILAHICDGQAGEWQYDADRTEALV